ncbi:MAG: accessory factor UbiK family protein [Gammaproteobacteria bacterium]|nr:accessory factor UbiK family protein [Gammaproteobacteria bacterium]
MALKPPPIGDFVQQLGGLLGESGLKGEVDRTLRTMVQSALSKLDMVNRDEFDAQAEILARTRARVEQLEQELENLVQQSAADG